MQVDAYIVSHQTCNLILTLYPIKHASWFLHYIPSNMQVDTYIISHQACELILHYIPSNMQVDSYIISHQICKLILTSYSIKHASWHLRCIPSKMQVDTYVIFRPTCKLMLTLYPIKHASWYLHYITSMQADTYVISHQTCKLILTLYPIKHASWFLHYIHQTCKLILTLYPIKHANWFLHYIPSNMLTVSVCFVLLWLYHLCLDICCNTYSSRLFHWHRSNRVIPPVPVKQPPSPSPTPDKISPAISQTTFSTFTCILLNENLRISLKVSLKFVAGVRIKNIPAMIQIMAPTSEPMLTQFTDAYMRSRWVNKLTLHCRINADLLHYGRRQWTV